VTGHLVGELQYCTFSTIASKFLSVTHSFECDIIRNRVQWEMIVAAIFVAAKRAKREQPENKPWRDHLYPNLLDDFLHCCCLIAVSWSTVLPGCKLESRISVVCCIGSGSLNRVQECYALYVCSCILSIISELRSLRYVHSG
jgi:hypothetical protein